MEELMGFSGFGKKTKKQSSAVKVIEQVKVISGKPFDNQSKDEKKDLDIYKVNNEEPLMVKGDESDSDNSNDSDSSRESVDLIDRLPFAAACSLKGHDRAVTALSVDRAQSRFVTGGRDNMVKLWDFSTMRGNFRPFFSIEPAEGCPIRDVQWGINGDCFLVVPSNWQPMLFDRDGQEVAVFHKGDPYLRDLKNVKGHTAALTCGRWYSCFILPIRHPNNINIFMTASLDSTIKIWDISNRVQCRSVLYTPSKGPGDKFAINSAVYSNDGRRIVAGDSGGSIKFWNASGMQTRAELTINNAHTKGNAITSVQLSLNGYNLISRCMDDSLKLWDSRNPSKSVASVEGLDIFHEETGCIYSPNEKYILAGSAAKTVSGAGYLHVFNSEKLEEVGKIELPSSCVSLLWPNRMEQVFCGLSNGDIKTHYDPAFSNKGIILSIMNASKKLAVEDYDKFMGSVEVPTEAADDEGDGFRKKSTWTRDRNLRKPEQPYTQGMGKKGMIGVNQTQHIMKNLLKNNTRLEDPREAILKYAKEAESNPIWIAPAYQKNQAKTVLAKSVYEDQAEEYRDSKKQRRK